MKSDIIKKPFRFLKNVMRWYQREADNILTEIRKEIITPELWKKAEDNFHRRGMPVPIYENHNEEQVVGSVEDIEAREDGLYVTAHRLFDKGKYLVEKEEYPLPSGDFVLHYDEYGNIVNIEIFGVSLVNSEGAKDVEPVTMNKSDKDLDYSVNRVIKAERGINIKNKSNKQGGYPMEKAEVLEILNDEEFLKSLPDDIIEKIIAIKESKDEEDEDEEVSQNKKEEEASQNKEEEEEEAKQNKKEEEDEEASQNKEEEEEAKQSKTAEEVQAIIDEVTAIMKNAGASEADIAKAIDKLNSLKEEEEEDKKVSVEAKKANKDEEEEEESKKSEAASMSKFEDMIAMHEAKTGARVVPSSVGQAKKLLRKTRAFMGKKAYKIAFDELSFVGGRSVEKAYMSKNANRKTGDIVKDILSY